MKEFMGNDFLLNTETARALYHGHAENMPIIDYHCHLSPREIAEDHGFSDIGELMLGCDHYKWRAMAAYGYDWDFIRNSDTKDRFFAFAKAIPYMMGNPIYHWTHLELRRVFGIWETLNEKSAQGVWERANEMLALPEFHARGLIRRFGVEALCTTDDPADDLRWHEATAADESFPVKVLPAFRPDRALKAAQPDFPQYVKKLEEATGKPVAGIRSYLDAIESRVDFFAKHGCRLSDHALDTVPFVPCTDEDAERILLKALRGEGVAAAEEEAFRTYMLLRLGSMYERRGWTQQYHMTALRNVNGRLFKKYGPDTGGDTMGDAPVAEKLTRLLDAQERSGALPQTILYSLNPSQNAVLASAAGSFQGGSMGRIQFGSAWWFCDHLQGMRDQMTHLASVGLLPTFVGMLTDSRSFVSYTRHEYFRRLLCDIIGEWVEKGEYPDDTELLGEIVEGICFRNARKYFGFE